jgi:hypothetical protein
MYIYQKYVEVALSLSVMGAWCVTLCSICRLPVWPAKLPQKMKLRWNIVTVRSWWSLLYQCVLHCSHRNQPAYYQHLAITITYQNHLYHRKLLWWRSWKITVVSLIVQEWLHVNARILLKGHGCSKTLKWSLSFYSCCNVRWLVWVPAIVHLTI